MQKFVVSPLMLLIFSAVLSFSVWLLLPDSILQDAGIRQKVSLASPLIVGGLSILTFGFGWVAGGWPRLMAGSGIVRIDRVMRILIRFNLVASLALVLLLANTARMYGLGGLVLTARGFIRPSHVEGVTTWVHLSTLTLAAALIFRAGMTNLHIRKALLGQALWGGVLALTRAVVCGERLAMLIPVVAALLGLATIVRRQILVRAFMVFMILGVVLVTVFTASELMRSYRAKKQEGSIDAGALNYSVNRLLLYYASSVNAGSAVFDYSRNEAYRQPLFFTTANPMAQVLYRLPGAAILNRSGTSTVGYATLVREGYRSRELTNIWGFASPFAEGHVWGGIYWAIWGALMRVLWRNATARPQASWWLVACSLASAGLLDCGRVLTIGSIHILLPLGVALVFAYHSKFAESIRSRAPMPIRRRS